MDSNLVLLFEIAGVLAVVFIGLVIFLLVRPKRSAPKEAELPAGTFEAGRVLYDTHAESVSLQMGGKTIQSRSDLTPDQEKAFSSFYQVLSGWYGKVTPAPLPPTSVEVPAGVPAAAPVVEAPVSEPAAVQSPEIQPIQRPEILQPAFQASVEAVKPAGGLINGIVRAVTADIKDPIRPKSIAEQVDDVLQEQLKNTPMEKRGIRMANDPDGGVLIWVGLQKFHGIDEIKDPEVQSAIKAAAAEWRRRTA